MVDFGICATASTSDRAHVTDGARASADFLISAESACLEHVSRGLSLSLSRGDCVFHPRWVRRHSGPHALVSSPLILAVLQVLLHALLEQLAQLVGVLLGHHHVLDLREVDEPFTMPAALFGTTTAFFILVYRSMIASTVSLSPCSSTGKRYSGMPFVASSPFLVWSRSRPPPRIQS